MLLWLLPALIAKQLLCMVLSHFTETPPKKIKTQQTDRANTPLLLRVFSHFSKNPGVRKWQNRGLCEASHSCSFHGRHQSDFIFTPAKGAFHQHHRYFLGLSFPLNLPYDYCVYPLAPTKKQTSNESRKQQTVLTSIQISVQYSSGCWAGCLVLADWARLNLQLRDELSFPWAILHSFSFLIHTVSSTNLAGCIFIFMGKKYIS